MWRSEEEMLEVVRQRAAFRRRRQRVLTGAVTGCVVTALALVVAVAAGGDGRPSEVRVAGSVEGGGASRGGPAPSPADDLPLVTTTVAQPLTSVPDETVNLDPPRPVAGQLQHDHTGDGRAGAVCPARHPGAGSRHAGQHGCPSSFVDRAPAYRIQPSARDGQPVGRRSEATTVRLGVGPRRLEGGRAVLGRAAACEPIGKVDVRETSATVTITLYTGRPPGEPQACIAIAVYQELIVELSAPLAARTIVDGAA